MNNFNINKRWKWSFFLLQFQIAWCVITFIGLTLYNVSGWWLFAGIAAWVVVSFLYYLKTRIDLNDKEATSTLLGAIFGIIVSTCLFLSFVEGSKKECDKEVQRLELQIKQQQGYE